MAEYGAQVSFATGATPRPTDLDSVVIFAVGTANYAAALPADERPLNRPILVRTLAEYRAVFGGGSAHDGVPAEAFTLDAVAEAVFGQYGGATLVVCNVFPAHDPLVDPADYVDPVVLIGGDDGAGNRTGLEVLEDVFPTFGVVPTVLLAPGDTTPSLVAALRTKAEGYGAGFRAVAVVAVGGDPLSAAAQVAAKATLDGGAPAQSGHLVLAGGFLDPLRAPIHVAGALVAAAAGNNGLPASPSNQFVRAGNVRVYSSAEVRVLRDAGIVTVQRVGPDGVRFAGNRTAAFAAGQPLAETAEEALVDSFIAARMTANYAANSLLLAAARFVDDPLRRAQIDRVVDAARLFGNRLVGDGGSLGFEADFAPEDNPATDLAAGLVRFRARFLPPPPMERIEITLAVDLSYFDALAE